MREDHHKQLTRFVADRVLGSKATAEVVSEWAAMPDLMCDIAVEGVGSRIFGNRLCSLTHFQVRTNGKLWLWRGYNWKLDGSVPRLDLPDRNVECYPSCWASVLGARPGDKLSRTKQAWVDAHPLAVLLRIEGINIAADEITYPTAASMAQWLSSVPGMSSKPNPRALGAICHFVQDACCYHHSFGRILAGHCAYEAHLEEQWHVGATDYDKSRAARCLRGRVMSCNGTKSMEPFYAVRRAAKESEAYATVREETIRRAIRHTASVMRWWANLRR